MKLRPLKMPADAQDALAALDKTTPADRARLALYLMKRLGYSEAAAKEAAAL